MGNVEVTNGDLTRIVHDSPGSLAKYAAAGFVPAKATKQKSDKDKKTEEN